MAKKNPRKVKPVESGYFILENSEDGDVRLTHVTREGLLDLLAEFSDDEVDPRALSERDIRGECESRAGSWDFANTGPRGMIIFKADSVIVPVAKQVKTVYEIPE